MVEGLHHQLVFYASVAPLVAFYVFFAAVLYPASAHLHPHGFYAAAAPLVPIGLRGLLKVRPSIECIAQPDVACTTAQASRSALQTWNLLELSLVMATQQPLYACHQHTVAVPSQHILPK